MASYEAIIFQKELFEDELKKIGDNAFDDAAEFIMNGEWEASEISDGDKEGIWDKVIDLKFDDLRAWVAEYGAGRHMRTDNPYLGEYLRSGLTYPLRPSEGTVVKRGGWRVPYESLDIETGEIVMHLSSNPPGKPLPQSFQDKVDTVPEPFLENLLDQAFRIFKDSFERQLDALDMSQFFGKEEIQV